MVFLISVLGCTVNQHPGKMNGTPGLVALQMPACQVPPYSASQTELFSRYALRNKRKEFQF